MPPPIFPSSEVDQNPNSVSLTTDPNRAGNFWRDYFAGGATSTRPGVGYNTANADAARTWQQQMIQDLQQAAAGNPNSAAQKGLVNSYTEARAGQSALGSSLRGTGGGAGLRAGAMGAGQVQRGFEGDKAMLMLQEKEAAQALLAQQLAQQRAIDAAQAQGTANNALGNQNLDDAMRQFYESQGLNFGTEQTQLAADAGRARMGFDLEASDTADRFGRKAVGAGATFLGTLGRQQTSGSGSGRTSQQTIDDAFNGE